MLTVAVIGCGAIAESFHLPALGKGALGEVALVLVDPDLDRARRLGAAHGVTSVARSHGEVLDRLDAAIIASPHHTHVPIAMELLEAGVSVLSEKPLGTSVAEVEALETAAGRSGRLVAVNHTRRFIPACREIHRILEAGNLGDIQAVDIAEGDRFGWPAATPSMFGRRSGGKGVLLDIGVHVIDLLTWWFGPGLEVESYHDDSFGGSEASALARLTHGHIPLTIRLSWLARQRNSVRIVGTEATLEWDVYELATLSLRSARSGHTSRIRIPGAPQAYSDLAVPVLQDFRRAMDEGTPPSVSPSDALPSIRLIEGCYESRRRFEMPWHSFQSEVPHGV